MGESARVESIDALESFKRALWKFAEAANVALGDAEADLEKTDLAALVSFVRDLEAEKL